MNDIPIINQLPEKWRGTALLICLALPYITRAYHALAAGGGLKGIWNAIWFGTNAPSSPTPATPGPSPSVIPLLLAAGLSATLIGCQTQDVPGRTLATTVQTVDAAMQGWATYVALGHAGPAQEAQVRAAYAQYQRAEAAAEKAYLVWTKTPDATGLQVWTVAASALRAAQADLLALVNSLSSSSP